MPKKFNKKRINGLTIFGILNLLIGIIGLLIMIINTIMTGAPLITSDYSNQVLSNIMGVFSWLISIILIAIGIGLLKHKKWAKKSMLYVSIISIFVNLVDGFVLSLSAITPSNYVIIIPSLIFSFITSSTYYILAIWYFTHY